VDDSAESGFTLDDRVWDAHLSAESWEIDDKLNRVDVIGDQDESGFLVFDKCDDVVETILDSEWFLADILLLLPLFHSRSLTM